MAFLSFNKTGISAIAAAVPHNVVYNETYTQYFPVEDVKKIVDKTGIRERRFADSKTCSSDLCYAAAEKLITDNNIIRDEIDLLVFITQTADYKMPANALLLQQRLGLSKSCAAFDINLGCSGFIYGLSVVYSIMSSGNIRKALILDGETSSKVYSPKDRKSAFLFGDAGAAVLVETGDQFNQSFFSLNSDGSLADLIKIPGGGYRNPSSEATLHEHVVDEYGNIRSDEQGYMQGGEVFNFVLENVPSDIKHLLSKSGFTIESIDYVLLHQANNFINSYLAKKLKINKEKVPSCIEEFGNTSSVSIPLTITSQLNGKLLSNKRLLLSAFGVGMSWASAIITVNNPRISPLIEI